LARYCRVDHWSSNVKAIENGQVPGARSSSKDERHGARASQARYHLPLGPRLEVKSLLAPVIPHGIEPGVPVRVAAAAVSDGDQARTSVKCCDNLPALSAWGPGPKLDTRGAFEVRLGGCMAEAHKPVTRARHVQRRLRRRRRRRHRRRGCGHPAAHEQRIVDRAAYAGGVPSGIDGVNVGPVGQRRRSFCRGLRRRCAALRRPPGRRRAGGCQ